MPDPPKIYWDSSVLLAYVNADRGHIGDIDAVLEEAARGVIELVTSTVTIAEVAFGAAEQQGQALDPAVEAKIGALWQPSSPVKLVEFHALIAAEAVQLIRQVLPAGLSLKPMDAIHLATASRMKVQRIETYDDKWPKFAAHLGIPIQAPAPIQPKLI